MDGEDSTDNPVDVNVKYEKEVRFALGVAKVTKLDGSVHGLCIPLFKYTEQTIVAQKDFVKKQKEQYAYIKSLTKPGQWVQDCREGRLFEEDDDLTLVKSLSKEMETKVKEQGVTQLKSLFDLLSDPPRRKHLIKHTKYLLVKKAHQ